MLVEKDGEREGQNIGVLSVRQVQVGFTGLEPCRGTGNHSKRKDRYRAHNEGGWVWVTTLTFCPELACTKRNIRETLSAFYFPHESPCTKKWKESCKTTTFMLCILSLPYPFWEVVTWSYNVLTHAALSTFSKHSCPKIFHFLTGHEDEVYSLFIASILTFLYTFPRIA